MLKRYQSKASAGSKNQKWTGTSLPPRTDRIAWWCTLQACYCSCKVVMSASRGNWWRTDCGALHESERAGEADAGAGDQGESGDDPGLDGGGGALDSAEEPRPAPAVAPEEGHVWRAGSDGVFGTAQDRLVKGMRLEGIGTIAEGNEYLSKKFLPLCNRRILWPGRAGSCLK